MKFLNRNYSLRIAGIFMLAVLFYSCDLSVDNPGSVEDQDLNNPEGIRAVVNGVQGDFANATTTPGGGGIYTSGALLSDELVHCGTWMPIRMLSDGVTINTEPENQSRWAQSSRARWTAENARTRIENTDGVPNDGEEMAKVTLFAGFANRMMGDNFCDAVIDGGERQDNSVFHERAVDFFSDAITLADNLGNNQLLNAAYAGRAQTHMMLGNWELAVQDARQVGTGFRYEQIHSSNSSREYNGVYRWTGDGYQTNQTTVWGTPFEEWGNEVNGENEEAEGDPRVSYEMIFDGDEIQLGGDNDRPLYYTRKYGSLGDNIPIVKGTEMRLIEAEYQIMQGEFEIAIGYMNEVREYHSNNGTELDELDPDEYDTADEVWELHMKERGIELWLEGRRVADLRRWMADDRSVPFQVIRESDDEMVSVLDVEDMCLAVSSDEEDANPNL